MGECEKSAATEEEVQKLKRDENNRPIIRGYPLLLDLHWPNNNPRQAEAILPPKMGSVCAPHDWLPMEWESDVAARNDNLASIQERLEFQIVGLQLAIKWSANPDCPIRLDQDSLAVVRDVYRLLQRSSENGWPSREQPARTRSIREALIELQIIRSWIRTFYHTCDNGMVPERDCQLRVVATGVGA